MTQPAQQQQSAKVVNLPEATLPVVGRVWTRPLRLDGKPVDPAAGNVLWQLGGAHPFVPKYKIVRMYVIPGGAVEVYSMPDVGETSDIHTRNTLPWGEVKFVEEVMDAATFLAEIEEAEVGEDDEDDDVPEPAPGPAPAPLVPLSAATAGTGSNGAS
jgi:hypothetical protein